MAEQLGDRQQVHAGLCQMRGVGVAQFVERYDRFDLGDFARGIEGADVMVMSENLSVLRFSICTASASIVTEFFIFQEFENWTVKMTEI